MGFLYDRITADFELAIAKGIYTDGARLPSIRRVRASYRVSTATAMRAFACLEEKGLVESRPKSGHYVKTPSSPPDEPSISNPSSQPRAVSNSLRTMEIIYSGSDPDLVSLATAVPSTEAISALARSTARVARLNARQSINYAPPEGSPTLRAAIARLLADVACLIHEDEIIVTNGAQEALSLGLQATTRPGEVVAVESPTYFGILQAIEALDLNVLELPTDPRRGVDLETVENLARSGQCSAFLLSSTFQNPLGFSMDDEDKQRLVTVLAECNVPLIEDDVYRYLTPQAPWARPFKAFDETGGVIHCGSFSKTVAPSLRVGWAVPGRFVDDVLRRKFLANLSTAMIPQLAVADYLTGNRFRRGTQAAARRYAKRLRTLRASVLRYFPEGTKCTDPSGGFVLWVQMPEAYSAMKLLGHAHKNGLSFLPGDIFSPSGDFTNCLRLSVGNIDDDVIPEVTEQLGQLAAHSARAG